MSLAAVRVTLAYAWRHRAWLDLGHPRRFTEWVQWRKLHDRERDRARLTDKLHSKRIVAAALGEDMVVPTLWEGQQLPENPPWSMPFVVKSNHGCRDVVVVRNADDFSRARRAAPRWLARAYGQWLDEWHYRHARRAILVEPYIGPIDRLPLDYKLYVFGGHAAIIQLHEERGTDHHRWSQFDRAWRCLSTVESARPAPVSLQEMITAAERLGADHDFLRVDFYEIDGRPLFGEFCLFPGSGLDRFDPVEIDERLGALWSAKRPAVATCRTPGRVDASGLDPGTC